MHFHNIAKHRMWLNLDKTLRLKKKRFLFGTKLSERTYFRLIFFKEAKK